MKINKCAKDYHIRSYECDRNNNLRILTLMNIFQDIALVSADELGFGLKFCLQNGMTWVGANYILEISRLPKVDEDIKIESWPSKTKLASGLQDNSVNTSLNN